MFKTRHWLVLILVGALVAAAGGEGKAAEQQGKQKASPAQPAQPTQIIFATGPSGGTWYPLGGAIAEIVQKEIPGATVSVQQGGGEANVMGVQKGIYQMGISYSHTTAEAREGTGSFTEKHPKVMGLMSLYPSALQWAARPDANINKISDLKGKKISPGTKGMSGEAMVRQVLKVYGLSYQDMAKVEYVSYSDSVDLMKDKHVDIFMPVTTWPAPTIQEVALQGGVNLLSIDPGKMKELKKINPGYATVVIPANTYKGQTGDVLCLGSYANIVISADMPEELVYKITRAILTHLDDLRKVHTTMGKLTPESAPKEVGAPLHPGAQKYYREIGVLK